MSTTTITLGNGGTVFHHSPGTIPSASPDRGALGEQNASVLATAINAHAATYHVHTAIADPGDAGAIPVTTSGYCPLVTGANHTRTLAAPMFIGQELLLYVKTDGGTVVITVASAINQTGNNTITMAEVRDVIRLVAIESGSSKVWHVVSNDGAALSTVP